MIGCKSASGADGATTRPAFDSEKAAAVVGKVGEVIESAAPIIAAGTSVANPAAGVTVGAIMELAGKAFGFASFALLAIGHHRQAGAKGSSP